MHWGAPMAEGASRESPTGKEDAESPSSTHSSLPLTNQQHQDTAAVNALLTTDIFRRPSTAVKLKPFKAPPNVAAVAQHGTKSEHVTEDDTERLAEGNSLADLLVQLCQRMAEMGTQLSKIEAQSKETHLEQKRAALTVTKLEKLLVRLLRVPSLRMLRKRVLR